MTIQDALYQYPTITEQIQRIKDGVSIMRATIHETKVTASYNGVSGAGCISDPTAGCVAEMEVRLIACIRAALAEIDALLDAKENVERALKAISRAERQVVEVKYFQGLDRWDEISKVCNYSKSHCKHLHKSAMGKMTKIVRNSTK